jgi:hypothetical protein
MRRILALGICALYLTFGFVVGAGHMHASVDHHEASHGLRLDHAHLGDPSHHEHERPAGHDDGDARYLSATAVRPLDSSLRMTPAVVSVGVTIDPPAAVSNHVEAISGQPRDPPRKRRPRPRAPPA